MCWLGYRYMDRKVPDEIRVSKGSEDQVQKLLDSSFLTFDDAVAVSGGGGLSASLPPSGVYSF